MDRFRTRMMIVAAALLAVASSEWAPAWGAPVISGTRVIVRDPVTGEELGSVAKPFNVSNGGATPAGEGHIGEVGGNQSTITVAQTVTASSAYTSGNAVGGLITFANASRVANGSGLVQSVVAYTKSAQTAALELWLFNANPSGSTCTDKTAFSMAAADFDKVVWVASISTWYSGGTPSVGVSTDHAIPFALASGSSLYGCLVARSTPTYASTSDVSVAIRVIRN